MQNNRFKLDVWNILEKLKKTEEFIGTKKGLIKEIEEYSTLLEKEFKNQSRIKTQREFLIFAIKRDMRE